MVEPISSGNNSDSHPLSGVPADYLTATTACVIAQQGIDLNSLRNPRSNPDDPFGRNALPYLNILMQGVNAVGQLVDITVQSHASNTVAVVEEVFIFDHTRIYITGQSVEIMSHPSGDKTQVIVGGQVSEVPMLDVGVTAGGNTFGQYESLRDPTKGGYYRTITSAPEGVYDGEMVATDKEKIPNHVFELRSNIVPCLSGV